ncbi:MAG: FCD domain-containing protein [Thermodesulfobacteriota bacterium]
MKRRDKPVQSYADLRRIRDALREKPRDLLLFDLVTQTGLGMEQILNLKVRDFLPCKAGKSLLLPHPGKETPSLVPISQMLYQSWEKYIKDVSPSPDDYVIRSQKKSNSLTLSSVSHLMRKWFEDASMEGLGGARSLRRKWRDFSKPDLPEERQSNDRSDRIQPKDYLHELKPVDSIRSLQETVHEELFQAIICGRIPPGEKLVIDKVAMEMKVSRIPVREAFHRLQEAGLISIYKWKGAVINKLSADSLREITVIRLKLEPEAAERAAENVQESTLNKLEQLHTEWKQSMSLLNKNDLQSTRNFLRLNHQFHHAIYSEAHMPILQQIINGLWNRVSPYLHILVTIEGAVSSETIRIHQGMLDGMRHHSPEEVSHWVREDLIQAETSLINFLSQNEDSKLTERGT